MQEALVVALGRHRYRVERRWGQWPATAAQGFISQVAVDSCGRVYLLQRSDPPVLVFNPDGSAGGTLGSGVIADGHGIAVDARDRVLVVDRDAHEIVGFDGAGAVVLRLGRRHQPSLGAPFSHPTDVAVAGNGEFYVSDGYGNSQVHRFAADGRHLASWGRPGTGPGEFSTPHAIWIDRQDRVLVADRENDRVQVFDRAGRYLAEWRDFYHPMDLWEDGEGNVVVSDQIPRLSLMAPDGELLGRCRGTLNGAHGVWGDRQGNLYLAELPPERLTRLVRLD
ncbi:MAG: hypothetical protein FJX68_12535 [Alphaproteobacteria bacterium]|nr:hypothetical protein [Alphaproteobacteria bacterium]